MPRYLVESSVGSNRSATLAVADVVPEHGQRSAEAGAVWPHGYLSDDMSRLYTLYGAPDPETVRSALTRDRFEIERITCVHGLDPSAVRPERADATALHPLAAAQHGRQRRGSR